MTIASANGDAGLRMTPANRDVGLREWLQPMGNPFSDTPHSFSTYSTQCCCLTLSVSSPLCCLHTTGALKRSVCSAISFIVRFSAVKQKGRRETSSAGSKKHVYQAAHGRATVCHTHANGLKPNVPCTGSNATARLLFMRVSRFSN